MEEIKTPLFNLMSFHFIPTGGSQYKHFFKFVPFYCPRATSCGQSGVLLDGCISAGVESPDYKGLDLAKFSVLQAGKCLFFKLLNSKSSAGRSENLVGLWPCSPGLQHLSLLLMIHDLELFDCN